jgi:gliding motility-associated lipoprotein GldH
MPGEKTEDSMIKGINRLLFISILIFFLLLVSCNKKVVYTNSQPMPQELWKLMDVVSFKVPITDSLSSNNVNITIRNGSSYPFRNIFLFVSTTSPEGKKITDTLQYNLADEKGKWIGRGFGDIHELNLPYKSNVFFPLKGIYEFKIQHGMRIENLKGVYDIGLRIERIKK